MGRYASGPCVLFKSLRVTTRVSCSVLAQRWGSRLSLVLNGDGPAMRCWRESSEPWRNAPVHCTLLRVSSCFGFTPFGNLPLTLNMFHPAVGIEGSRYVNAVGSEFSGMKLQLG